MDKVNICVPCFNNSETIEETLESIRNQIFTDYQINIYENCSTDNSVQIVKNFAEKNELEISVIKSKQTLSAEENFTRCIKNANYEFTGIFHSDDVYNNSFLKSVIQAFQRHEDVGAVFTHANLIDVKSKLIGKRFLPPELRDHVEIKFDFHKLFKLVLKYGNFITCPAALIRSRILRDEIQIWDGEQFGTSADLDVWLRIAKSHKVLFLTEPLLNYRVSGVSLSHQLIQIRVHRHDLFRVLEVYIDEYEECLTDLERDYYEFLNFKDQALRKLNFLKIHQKVLIIKRSYRLISVIRVFWRSRFHFKFFCISSSIHLLVASLFFLKKEIHQS